jgi:hypothetical protein
MWRGLKVESPSKLLQTLLTLGFEITPASCKIPLPQPFWVNADRTDVTLTFTDDETVEVCLSFEHNQTLLKFGKDLETVSSMKELCASDWFPDLARAFKRISDHFDLKWEKEGEDYEFNYPWISYHLSGAFKLVECDRIISLLFEIRSVLNRKECRS